VIVRSFLSGNFEQEALELDEDGLDRVGGGPAFVPLARAFEHIQAKGLSEDIGVSHVGEQGDRGGTHGVVLREVDLHVEHTAFVGSACGSTNVGVPSEDGIIQGCG